MNTVESFAEHYASMPDDDLQRLSLEVATLVPNAREALRAELERRQFSVVDIDWTAQPRPDSDLQTVGGWLLFYCVCAVIIQPIWMLVALLEYPIWLFLFVLPLGILQTGAGLLLWKRNPKGLRWSRWGFLYTFGCALLLLLLSLGKAIPAVVMGSLPTVLWWTYFRRSQRVKAVFGHNMQGLPWQRDS